jgi:thioredoxin-related protein
MKYILFAALSFFSLATVAQPKPAQMVLMGAYKQAKKENKNIILIFHASWCVWCRKMDSAMADIKCKKFFDDNYVTIHLTVEESKDKKDQENPGGAELKTKFNGEKAGLPFWVVLDKDGNLLFDSYMRNKGEAKDAPGDNIGCPASENEVVAFINILKQTSSITDEQLKIIAARFKENK